MMTTEVDGMTMRTRTSTRTTKKNGTRNSGPTIISSWPTNTAILPGRHRILLRPMAIRGAVMEAVPTREGMTGTVVDARETVPLRPRGRMPTATGTEVEIRTTAR